MGLSQERFAHQHSVSLQTVRRWESGLTKPLPAIDLRLVQLESETEKEPARRGSRNYRFVLDRLNGGAELRKTEDPVLLLREREYLLDSLRKGHPVSGLSQKPGKDGDSLSRQRDALIAGAINATLKDGDMGVLFIGADHDIVHPLDGDVSVEMLKELAAGLGLNYGVQLSSAFALSEPSFDRCCRPPLTDISCCALDGAPPAW